MFDIKEEKTNKNNNFSLLANVVFLLIIIALIVVGVNYFIKFLLKILLSS